MKTDSFRLMVCLIMTLSMSSVAIAAGEGTSANTENSSLPRDSDSKMVTVPPGYVFGVTVSTVQQLDVILDRADSLQKLFNPEQHGRIAIVLHGDELQLFQKNNYSANQSIVERARLLDQNQIIDIKACQTRMRDLNIQQSELPSFIEQVPFAPAEIERLKSEKGFTLF